jgi:putative ABC transport system ATP-binding protein
MIDITQLRYAWPGAPADTVHIPTLKIAAGQRVFLQGPSGCGKSTLLSLMAGVLVPQAGHVRVLDTDWSTLSGGARDKFRADHIGLIFQQFNLLPYLSALDNVCLPCTFSDQRRQRASAGTAPRAAAEALMSQMNVPADTWHRPAGRLSVGQQQRVAAARALMGRPSLIIADEPTSALDPGHSEDFMTLLMAACADAPQPTLIMVSHDDRRAGHFDRRLTWQELTTA